MTKFYVWEKRLSKHLKTLFTAFTVLLASVAFAQLSGTYTINSGSTTSGTNYNDFADFASDINANGVSGPVVVNVVAGSGPYVEYLELNAITGTSATNTVRINGNGETLSYAGSSSRSPVITLSATKYVTIDDLVVINTGTTYGRCVQIRDLAEFDTISNCELRMPNMTGTSSGNCYVLLGNGTNTSIYTYALAAENCVIMDNETSAAVNRGPYFGIVMMGPNGNTTTKGNQIIRNDIMDFYVYGLYSYYGANNMLIDGNRIHNDGHSRTSTGYGMYMYHYNAGSDVTITNNMIYNLNDVNNGTRYATYLYFYYGTGTKTNLIANNVIHVKNASFSYGLMVYAPYGGSDYDIHHNTVHYSGNISGTHYMNYIGYINGTYKNNIVNNEMTGNGTIYGLYGFSNAGIGGPTTFTDNNFDLENAGVGVTKNYAYYNAAYSSFASLSSIGSNWHNNAPGFADPSTLNFIPLGFGMANLGSASPVSTDILGNARNSTNPDVGAFEFFLDAEIVSVDMVGSSNPGSPECAPYTEPVVVTVKNNSGFALPQVYLEYSINGGTPVQELVTPSSPIAIGATYTYTFADVPTFNGTGSHVIDVSFVGTGDDVPSNDDGTYTIETQASATGSDLVMSSTFGGYYNNGSAGDPDVTVNTYESRYDITRPNKYSTAGPGTDYSYALNATTSGGVTVGSAEGFEIVGEELIVDPATTLSDSTIWMEVTVSDLNTGCDTVFGRYMYVPHTPVASFTATDICLGDVAQFTNTSTLAGADYMLQNWEFDDPDASVMDDNSDILDGFWNYTTYGTADVELTVVNGVYPKFEYTTTQTITITPKPEVDFKVLNACEGTAIQFNNLTTLPVPGTLAYAWDFADGNTSTATSPSHLYSSPGQRTVSLTATANGCDATVIKNAYQFEAPTASFTHVGACNNADIQFNSTSTIPNGANMGYTWDFNTGSGVSTLKNPKYNSPSFGTIPVSLTVISEFGCTDVSTQNITLLESPVADFTWNNGGPACNLTPVSFTNIGTAPNGGANTSYAWSEDGTQFSTNENPMRALSDIGIHTIKFTAADLNGCSNSITKEVNVVLQATADFVAMNVCEGQEAVFTNTSTVAAGNLNYIWTFPSGSTGTSTNHTGKEVWPVTGNTRVINVTLDAIVPGGCSDQITKAVTINAVPNASHTADVQGRFVYVTAAATSGVSIYQWSAKEGTPAGSETGATESYEFTNIDKGTFDICLAVRNDNCWNDDCQKVTIDLASVEDLTENNDMIKVYPNPTTGEFNLVVDNASDDVVVIVSDILGNSLPLELTDNLNGNYVVNLSGIANGVYFVQVKNGDFYATQKITVSK